MATIFETGPVGDDPVIIEDPGGGTLIAADQAFGLRIVSKLELKSLENGDFHATWLCRVKQLTISDSGSTAVHGPFTSPSSIVIKNAGGKKTGVFSFAGHRVVNIDPPAVMLHAAVGDYHKYYNYDLGKITGVTVDGVSIDVSTFTAVVLRLIFETT